MNEIMRRALADAMRPLVELVYKLESKLAGKPHFEWGTVVSADPLRVKLDSHTTPLPDQPDTLVTGLRTGDRVRVERQGTRVTIHGAGNGVKRPDRQPFAMAAQKLTTGVAGGWNARTFPAGRFTAPPVVTAQVASGSGGHVGTTLMVSSEVSASGFSIRASTASVTVDVIAVQMSEGSGAG